jgi:hypothetical protein
MRTHLVSDLAKMNEKTLEPAVRIQEIAQAMIEEGVVKQV